MNLPGAAAKVWPPCSSKRRRCCCARGACGNASAAAGREVVEGHERQIQHHVPSPPLLCLYELARCSAPPVNCRAVLVAHCSLSFDSKYAGAGDAGEGVAANGGAVRWCTWDAFYSPWTPPASGRASPSSPAPACPPPPRFLVIDDGWQSMNRDKDPPQEDAPELVLGGDQMTALLYRFDECARFRWYREGDLLRRPPELFYDRSMPRTVVRKAAEVEAATKARKKAAARGGANDLSRFEAKIEQLRRELEQLLVMREHVLAKLCGGWGGVRPGATALDARVVPARPSPGLAGTMDDLAVDRIVEGGIGLVRPDQAGDLYESMHSYLAGTGVTGVTGVKVDVMHAKVYYDGLSKSIAKVMHAGDDFLFDDPNGEPMGVFWLQGTRMVNCAYNSLWMGQFVRPDWDMFPSDHACAAFHAASRAICGGPVYVSDSLGGHDFALLRRLVFADGTVPRCLHYALPTRDCLFKNPLFDQETVLKIWNLNKFGGVVGAFNCQGAGWDPAEHRVRGYSHCYKPVSGDVRPADIEWRQREDTYDMATAPEYAVFRSQSEELLLMTPESEPIQFSLQPSSFDLFTFAPVKTIVGDGGGQKFAPIGLVDMLNCGGAIVDLEYGDGGEVRMKVKGAGRVMVYSNVRPKRSLVDGCEAAFEWGNGGKLVVGVSWKQEKNGVSDVVLCY